MIYECAQVLLHTPDFVDEGGPCTLVVRPTRSCETPLVYLSEAHLPELLGDARRRPSLSIQPIPFSPPSSTPSIISPSLTRKPASSFVSSSPSFILLNHSKEPSLSCAL